MWLMHFFCQSLLLYIHTWNALAFRNLGEQFSLWLFGCRFFWITVFTFSFLLWVVKCNSFDLHFSLFHNIDNMKYALNACTHTYIHMIQMKGVFLLAKLKERNCLTSSKCERRMSEWTFMRAFLTNSSENFGSEKYYQPFYYLCEWSEWTNAIQMLHAFRSV